jgi:hypothetical protein
MEVLSVRDTSGNEYKCAVELYPSLNIIVFRFPFIGNVQFDASEIKKFSQELDKLCDAAST